MFLGIDVGGTFTDAVAVSKGRLLGSQKVPTTHGDLLQGILAAVDRLLEAADEAVERVSLSTTVVTNSLVEGKMDPVGLFVMPGPGLDILPLLPDKAIVLPGYIDHRGRESGRLVVKDLAATVAREFPDRQVFAVSGKFAVRNPQHENSVARELAAIAGVYHVTRGGSMAGSLNFLRRTNTAYFNAAVWRRFGQFASAVEGALAARHIAAPVHILKADGGTLPLAAARERPVEAIFTGPAASVLGIMALCRPEGDTISLDIGGTTTDIALWRDSNPLITGQGAMAGAYPTAVRSFWLHSAGVGGDSYVRRENGILCIGPERKGAAMVLGGEYPALADALVVSGRAAFGETGRAYEAMRQVALPGMTAEETAAEVVQAAVTIIGDAVRHMIRVYEEQPVYTVGDMMHGRGFVPASLVGVGGTSAALAPVVADRLGTSCIVPQEAAVANALGAALARPTTDITVRVDTEEGYLSVAELGLRDSLPRRNMSMADVRSLAAQYLAGRSRESGITVNHSETVYEEEFTLVRGFSATGKIMTCCQQAKPGVMAYVR